MFGKNAECSSVEAPACSFRQERNLDLQVLRPASCTPLLCKLKADRMSAWRTGRPCRWRKSFLGSRLFKPIVLGVQAGSLRSLDFVRD